MADIKQLSVPVNEKDHILGNKDTSIILLEYGDYECPYSGEAFLITQKVVQTMKDDLRFVFRNFPLENLHLHAEEAAEAAEAAGVQGKFWEMYRLLFENQDRLSYEDLVIYAQHLFLDEDRFINDLQSKNFSGRVKNDLISGVESGVAETPTFFINGVMYTGPYDYDSIISTLENIRV